jgi:hypothetical protein
VGMKKLMQSVVLSEGLIDPPRIITHRLSAR